MDERGQIIARKTPADFARSAGDERPRVLVTGGTGFIGNHLVQRLVSEGWQVRVLCRPTSSLDCLPTDGVQLAFGDVSDFDSVRRAMEGIEVLYHLAAATGGDWAAYYQGTVVGTRNVLRAAAEAGVGKVVHVSSLSVLHPEFDTARYIVSDNPLQGKKILGYPEQTCLPRFLRVQGLL